MFIVAGGAEFLRRGWIPAAAADGACGAVSINAINHTLNILTSLCPVFQPADTLLWKVISAKIPMLAEKSAADLEMNFCSRDGF